MPRIDIYAAKSGAEVNWKDVFFSFDGRIGRQTFWIATIICMIISYGLEALICAYYGLEFFPDHVSPLRGKITLIFVILSLWPYLAISIKRQHDLNKTGKYFTLYFLLALAIFIPEAFGYPLVLDIENISQANWLMLTYVLIIIIGFVWYLIWQGFIKGTPGPNKYGPDPLTKNEANP